MRECKVAFVLDRLGYLDHASDRFKGQYTDTILKVDTEFRNKLFVLHRLFAVLVDHPKLKVAIRALYRMRPLNWVLNLWYRFYYARHMHGRIYAGQIPLRLRLRGALGLLLSKDRV